MERSQPVGRQVASFDLQLLGDLDLCEKEKPGPEPGPCDPTARFRTIDATCNNLENPDWGATFTAFRRVAPPDYGDGEGSAGN